MQSVKHFRVSYKLKTKYGEDIEYNVICLHQQHIEESHTNGTMRVSGRNKFDNLVESCERETSNGKYHAVGFQHHPEAVITACRDARSEKIAEADKEAYDARFEANFHDSDYSFFIHHNAESRRLEKVREAKIKTRDEKAAQVELGLFGNQVKRHHLETTPNKREQKSNTSTSDYYHSMDLFS